MTTPRESRERVFELAERYGSDTFIEVLVKWLPTSILDEFYTDTVEDLEDEE